MTPREKSKELRLIQERYKHYSTPMPVGLSIAISNMAKEAADAIDDLLVFVDNVFALPNCNDCKRRDCEFKPKLGETIRFNCPIHMKNSTCDVLQNGTNLPTQQTKEINGGQVNEF